MEGTELELKGDKALKLKRTAEIDETLLLEQQVPTEAE